MRRREVARAVGVSLLSARKLWRALGFANVADEDVAFTDEDEAVLTLAIGIVRRGLVDEPTSIAFARALGQTTDRLASWQAEALIEYLNTTHGDQARAVAPRRILELVDDLEELLVCTWRRQLSEALSRLLAEDGERGQSWTEMTVGFADLVSYTRLAQELDQAQLGHLVQRFEGLASDLVAAGGGRVVKTVGDEVLFTADDPVSGALIALSLSEQMAVDDLVPDVRVGLAHGLVLRSLGDVYGATVNLASRLTALAQPGTVVTDVLTGTSLAAADPDLGLVPQRRRQVRGYGMVQPMLIARMGPGDRFISLD